MCGRLVIKIFLCGILVIKVVLCGRIVICRFCIYASLIWATTSLFSLKWSTVENGMDGSENDWGFGQLLPLLSLILPVFAAWEIIYGAQ